MFHEPIEYSVDMKYYAIFLATTCLLLSCNSHQGQTIEERRAEQEQRYKDQLATERNTLHVTDSLINAISVQINKATDEGFEYEKTEYDDLGRFRPKGSDPGDNVQRTYLRSAVDEYGRTQLICTYCGSKKFCVEQLRISSSDGTSIVTQSIAPNDGSNYSYDIDGTHYQSVTFVYAGHVTEGMTQDSTMLANADTDNGALGFIAQHADDVKLQCVMISSDGNEQKMTVTSKDLKQLAATYELGVMLRECTRLRQENKTASLKIQYLEERERNKAIENNTNNQQ